MPANPSDRTHADEARSPKPDGRFAGSDQASVSSRGTEADAHTLLREMLLAIEAEVRQIEALPDLYLLIANQTRKLTGARQVFVFRCGQTMRMTAISGLPKLDRNAALIQELEALVCGWTDDELDSNHDHVMASHPFPHLIWQPFKGRGGELQGGMLLASERIWTNASLGSLNRLGDCYAYALRSLSGGLGLPLRRQLGSFTAKRGRVAALLAVLVVLILAIPIRMSVLAPMEIAAKNPFVVAAPSDGVIQDVLVEPGDRVQKGDPLIKMDEVEARNKVQVAQQEVQVAEARLKKANQLAFSNDEGRKELRMAMANLDLKQVQLRYAQDLYSRSAVRAERSGVVVLSDKQSLKGKPVVTGERIMQIADPSETELVIRVPVKDALVLEPGARVKAFLDSDPFGSREARILFADYQALPDTGNQLSFRVVASFIDGSGKKPRLGVRGTAQIYGDRTVLGFYLFRRPLTALRQWIRI